MSFPDSNRLKAEAAAAVDRAPLQKKIVLIWAGASAALALLISVVSFLLENQISGTGGLSGIGLRSVLSTAQSVLSLASAIAIPFWDFGYTAAVLRISRNEDASVQDLAAGFRRFGPALRLLLLRYFIYLGLAFLCFYLGSTVLSLTPLAQPAYQVIANHQDMLLTGVIEESVAAALLDAMIPLLIGCAVLYLIVLIPIFYKLRLADFRVMDDPRCGALAAMLESRVLMRGARMRLFKLDLNFWWFYLAQLLVTLLSYGDVLLPALGITLPFSGTAAFFAFYVVALAAQLLLMYLCSNRIQVTYARFYDTLKQAVLPADTAPPQERENTAWD